MTMVRCFVAIELSAETRRRAGDLIARLGKGHDRIKWVRPDQAHLTLNFLGDVELTQVAHYCRAATRAAVRLPAFSMHCGGAGAFPHLARPRALWLGVFDPEPVCQIQETLSQELASVGWTPEHRRFHPHITLGRLRGAPSPDLGELIERYHDFDAGITDVDEVVVFSSRLQPDGPEYEVLGRAGLEG